MHLSPYDNCVDELMQPVHVPLHAPPRQTLPNCPVFSSLLHKVRSSFLIAGGQAGELPVQWSQGWQLGTFKYYGQAAQHTS